MGGLVAVVPLREVVHRIDMPQLTEDAQRPVGLITLKEHHVDPPRRRGLLDSGVGVPGDPTGRDESLRDVRPPGRERVPWSLTALILVIARLCEPSSELHIAEHFYRQTALCDLLGVPIESVDDNRLYRGLDALLPHKPALEAFLKQRFGELFAIEYDLLLYDVTSTYFEGQANANPLAQRGYSRDHLLDFKQGCIGLVGTRCGLPVGYEVFAGNRHDSTTLEEIVQTMEARYGQAQRIWALDRGMVSQDNLDFLKAGGRQYIVGTPKSQLKRFEQQLATQDWHTTVSYTHLRAHETVLDLVCRLLLEKKKEITKKKKEDKKSKKILKSC